MASLSKITKPLDLTALSNEDLRAALTEQMQLTAQGLTRTAAIVAELERRGEDLADLKIGMLRYLRLIAAGQAVPEIVVRYADCPMLLARLLTLPIADQQRFAAGDPVRVLVRRQDALDHLLVDPRHLTRDQVLQVFGPVGLRDDAAQLAVIESRLTRPVKPPTPTTHVRADRASGKIRVGRALLDPTELVAALADLREVEPDEGGETKPVPIFLTETQHKKLRIRAAESGRTMQDLVRSALRANGLI